MSTKIDFSNKEVYSKVKAILEQAKEDITEAESGTSWDEVNEPLDNVMKKIQEVYGVASHLNNVMNNDHDASEFEKTIPMVSEFYNGLGTNKDLYSAYKRLKQTELNDQQKYILDEGIKGFKLGGIDLSPRGQELLMKINTELSLLENEFGKNALKATNSWTKKVSESDLEGLSDSGMEVLRDSDGELSLNLQMPAYMEVMTNADSEDIRKEIYMANISRASKVGITPVELNNEEIMGKILSLRQEKANVLGFESYADLSIYSKMVDSPKMVEDFLNELIEKSYDQATTELNELKDFSKKDKLNPWDLMYYADKLKQNRYGYSKEQVKEYFDEKEVMKGLFSLIKNLYSVDFKKIEETTYHKDVSVYELYDDDTYIGKLYFDPYARENKRGGAWMDDYQSLSPEDKPIAYVVCNFSNPEKGADKAYFELDEVVTLFHEFGHAIHHLLSKVIYPSASGISGVPWDGVELPSQYMENFVFEKDIMLSMTKQKDTGEQMPDELYSKIIESKNYSSAMQMLRQCEFSLWDIKTHSKDNSGVNTYDVLREVEKKTSLMPKVEDNRFLNTFGHIFAGGYDAGYFSYKWAEIMSADAYKFINRDTDKSDLFRKCILESGGSADFLNQYILFRGQEPDPKALLEMNGIGI